MNEMTTPDIAAPMGRWRALAARCPGVVASGDVLSTRWRNALFVLFIGGILAYGAGFAWYMLARLDLINLIRDVSTDDAFYYYQIARNLAEGKFSTFDGGIMRTNGYHPIWMFLITPFHWVFDKEAALFAIKALEIMLVAGGVALVAAAARVARMPWVLMFAALPMLYQLRALFLGMEAAAGLFMLGLFVLTACLFARSPARWKWPLAAVAFALPWVRLEYIAISLATTGALCLVEWSWQERAPGAPLGARARSALSGKAVFPFLAAGAGLLVYFAYNKLVFGGIVPVSGASKQAWSQAEWQHDGGYSLIQNFQDVLRMDVFGVGLPVALAACALFLLVWWFAHRSGSREDRLLLAFLAGVSGLAVGHLAKFGQTVLTVHPVFHGRYAWYFVPAYLLMALVVPVSCCAAVHFIRRFIGPKSHRAANVLSRGIVVAGAVFLLVKADFASPFRWVEASRNSARDEWAEAVYGGMQLMNRVLPEDSVVGSWDAGVIGYFSRFPVVNLDGLVSSYDYFHATNVARDGYAGWDQKFIPLYRELGITHFANLTSHTRKGFDGEVLFEGSLSVPGRYGRKVFTLFPGDPPTDANAAPWFWRRMAPHFDYQSDGAGLLVDGRLVQTIARECDPSERVVWRWTGRGDGTVTRAWTQTRTGLCVAAAVLPHPVVSGPIRFQTMSVSDYLTWLTRGSRPIIRSDWHVYLVENSLIYVKAQCSAKDAQPVFFLHLVPVEAADLSIRRRPFGFDNLDFRLTRSQSSLGAEGCLAIRELPDYPIAAIHTGQYAGEGRIWGGSFDVVTPAGDGKAAP